VAVVIKYYYIIVINNIVRDDASLQGRDVMSFVKVIIILEAVNVSETLVTIYKLAWHFIPGNLKLHQHCSENLRSYNIFTCNCVCRGWCKLHWNTEIFFISLILNNVHKCKQYQHAL